MGRTWEARPGGEACDRYRYELGAYVLDAVDPQTAEELEAHLATCPACRAEHEEIAGVPALLELAREAPPVAPARVRDRVIAAAARRRTRRRWMATTTAAAAAAALIGGFAGWRISPSPEPVIAVPLAEVEPFQASGWAHFRLEGERVVVELDVDGLEELPGSGVYEAWLSTNDDQIVSIGLLDVDDDGRSSVALIADGPPERYRGFWVTAEPDDEDPAHDGPTVLEARMPPLADV